jgi:hypothetical protein
MAINAPVLELLLKSAAQTQGPKRLVCLGYPDMLVTEAQLTKLCGSDILDRIQFREDSRSILQWHGLANSMTRMAESQSLFTALGMSTDFLDIYASRGFEIVADLNKPLPSELHGRYDLIYDGGTVEHCFNIGQVMRNILQLGKVGACIVHINPLNYYNHGFFNFNPTFYHDFYTQSGNRLASEFYGVYGPVLNSQLITLPPLKGFSSVPERTTVMVAAQKLVEGEPVWPLQSKYRNNPDLRG